MVPRGAAAGAVAVLLLAGCAAGDDAPILATYETVSGSGDQALLEGQLELDGDCVTVVEALSGKVVVPVFPRQSASVTADGLRWDGHLYTDGDTISLGGGFVDAPAPQGCPPTTFTVSAAS